MIFRWSIWEEHISKNIELLRYSVLSFRKQFGSGHQYIIYTDNADFVSKQLGAGVDVKEFPTSNNSKFCIKSKATWQKWCPSSRLDVTQDEFYVDSDIFLLKYPEEIDLILSDQKIKFAIMDEFLGKPYQHGAMHKKATSDMPFVNAGLFLQKAGYDISKDLTEEFEWWQKNIKMSEQTHHDEQGALAVALTKYAVNGELFILPKAKYMLISETSNIGIESLDGVTVFHATYPTHPAFYKFKHTLDEILGDKSKANLENINETNNIIAILMSVRDEESYIDFNISYHLDLGFDYIFIANHCSTDGTNKILDSYKDDPRVVVIEEKDPVFDHVKIANKLLGYANANYKIDWFIFLDADEFLSVKDGSIHDFVAHIENNGIPYATIGWANALFDYTLTDYTCAPVNPIDTTKYYYPWPEKEWQEYGHFRKAIVKNHKNMEIVVGGHYVETGKNPEFFGEYHWNPFIVPKNEARLLHFEFRGKAEDIYKKWEKLASFEHDSTSDASAPWLERIRTIRQYIKDFKDNVDEINKRWFSEHRTFWGTIVPEDRIIYDATLSVWYRKYFRRKIESGKIKSVCLVRSGYLGDVIMAEPIARFLLKYVDQVCLATEVGNMASLFSIYDKVYKYSQINSGEIDCDITIRLIYELSNNQKTYIQGYMESIGFGDVTIKDIPMLNSDWDNIVDGEYILIAPFTSSWEEKKRNWGYKKFIALSKLLEAEYHIKCVVLEKHYSFGEMMSLIKHCKLFIGNDSGPAIIAQSFNKRAFIIFGATRPDYIHISEHAVPIYDRTRHKLCKHNYRQEEVDCCEEFCMDRIRVNDVFNQISILWQK